MRKSILAVAVAAATVVSGANAAGFYLKEQSVVGQGRAFAGSAAGTDGASAAYFNPAGIVGLERQVEVGVHVISPDVTVTNDGTTGANTGGGSVNTIEPYEAKPVPNAHFVMPIDDETSFGLALGAPFGFSNNYGDTAFSRLDNVKVELTTIELSASVAKQISEQTSISVGLVYQDMEVEQTFGAGPVGTQTVQKGAGDATGLVLGLKHDVSESTTIGMSYRSQNTVELTGTLAGGAYAANAGGAPFKANFELPSIFAFGIAHEASENTRLYADATYYGWSAYEKLEAIATADGQIVATGLPSPAPATVTRNTGDVLVTANNNYRDTVSFGLGMEHDYDNGMTVRAGLHFDPTPTNDTDRSTSTPDSDRTWVATGFTKQLESGLVLDAAFTHIIADDGNINKTTPGNAQVKAKVESSVNILSLGLRYKF